MKKVCILGGGAFGTAMACLLADNGCEVSIWCCEHEVAESINIKNINNMYLPDIKLSENILAFTDFGPAIADCEIIFEAVPVKYLRSVLEEAKKYFDENQIWVCCSKGVENETLLFPSQIIDSVFNESIKKVVISGPSFARELAQKQITAVDIASQDQDLLSKISQVLVNDYFKPVITQDIFGVQIGGALKNVAAIGAGMLDGLGCKENTKALFFNLCLQEIVQIAQIFGAQKDTIYGLSGVGDLIATCAGGSSKNFRFGHYLACTQVSGKELLKINDNYNNNSGACELQNLMHIFPEGVNTAKSVYQMIQVIKNLGSHEFNLNRNIFFGDKVCVKKCECASFSLPIFEVIHDIIFDNKSIQELVCVLKNK